MLKTRRPDLRRQQCLMVGPLAILLIAGLGVPQYFVAVDIRLADPGASLVRIAGGRAAAGCP
jgi:hypothetical protein